MKNRNRSLFAASVYAILGSMTRRGPYTISEASKHLGISRESVFEAIKKGRLKARLKTVKIPRKLWLIFPESVETYVVSPSHQERGLKNA